MATFEPGDEPGAVVVSFPDVPQAITQGDDEADARAMAREVLTLTLLELARRGEPLPQPKAKKGVPITLEPDTAVKIALIEAFSRSELDKRELGRRLGKDEKEVRRLLDPKHTSKLGSLSDALAALGQRVVIGIEDAA